MQSIARKDLIKQLTPQSRPAVRCHSLLGTLIIHLVILHSISMDTRYCEDMRVQEHIKLSTAAAVMILPWLKKDVWIPFVSSVLIDVDHYLWHAMAHRTLSLRAALRYFEQADPPQLPQSRLLHQPVVLGILLVITMRTRSRLLWLIFVGLLYHVSLDLVHVTQMKSLQRRLNEQAQHICPQCGGGYEELQLHTNHFAENIFDRYNARHFVVLCPTCHEEAHSKNGNSQVVAWNGRIA